MIKDNVILADVEAARMMVERDIKFINRWLERGYRGEGGRELSLARTKLQEARYWLVEAFNELTNPDNVPDNRH